MEMERIGTPEVSKFLLSMDDKETSETPVQIWLSLIRSHK